MDKLIEIANKTIPAFTKKDVVEFENGDTNDIIAVISKNHKAAVNELKEFAAQIPGTTEFDKCRNLWYFLFTNVRYQLDPYGEQLIKKPNALWGTKFGDCKSFALFICGCLENMGINYNYKYVSFSPSIKNVTHVYVEAYPEGKKVFMDVPLRIFNQEKKPHYHVIIKTKKDMTQIRSIGATGPSYKKIIDLGPNDIGSISDGEFDLWIAKDRLETERNIVDKKRGINGIGTVERYNDMIDVVNDAIASIGASDVEKEYEYIAYQAHLGRYSNADTVCGIGAANRYDYRLGAMQQRADERRAWREAGLIVPQEVVVGKLGKWLKKTAKKTIKKGVKLAKFAAKVITFPMRLAAKGILEVTLPKAAPFFLYLFLTDAQSAAAPAKIKAKRRRAKDIANFIVDFIGMKRSHFMHILRNGIMKHYKQSPERVLQGQMKTKISGVGDIGIAPIIIQAVITIISLIMKLTKKKPAGGNPTTDDAPAPEDWGGVTEQAESLITKELSSGKEVVNYTDEGASSTTNYNENTDITKTSDVQASEGQQYTEENTNDRTVTTGFCK